MLIQITEDLYDIAWRVKAFSVGYEIFYDTQREKYILTHNGQEQLVFPYEQLDTRALSYVFETRIENLDTLIRDIDRKNQALERKNLAIARDRMEDGVSEALRRLS